VGVPDDSSLMPEKKKRKKRKNTIYWFRSRVLMRPFATWSIKIGLLGQSRHVNSHKVEANTEELEETGNGH
jgi:hypothetical protein